VAKNEERMARPTRLFDWRWPCICDQQMSDEYRKGTI